MNETIAYLPGLSPIENKKLCARFDGGRPSPDGGVLVQRGIEKCLGLAARLAGCLMKARRPTSRVGAALSKLPGNESGLARFLV